MPPTEPPPPPTDTPRPPQPTATPRPARQPVYVNIVDFAFEPATITIDRGTTVIWTNVPATIHTVAAVDISWSSEVLQKGDTYSRVFDTPGTITVICSIHPEMVSTVVVR